MIARFNCVHASLLVTHFLSSVTMLNNRYSHNCYVMEVINALQSDFVTKGCWEIPLVLSQLISLALLLSTPEQGNKVPDQMPNI